ncbi:MAG: acetyl/propionyl/methylcrotonyl-CoA carboxylase subunit alpha [Xanthomonadales bacterium]
MFEKILIANRGEIACRVIRTARRMGVKTVAVYSDADRDALHVSMADEAVHIGAPPPRESYLLGERIIEACAKTGAEAVHPGYGFLSENAGFSRMCKNNGIVFIGPPESAIESMGSKSTAKTIMSEAGVAVVPGYHGNDPSTGKIKHAADEMGYPVLLKAVAGGGGKGMRLVRSAAEFDRACAAARREAASSFGSHELLVEKYLSRSRHVEFQVFCDRHGNAVYLFERDCSVQRRHQKVIEEAPAPGMGPDLRQQMGQTAVQAARALDYEGAGTVEFLLEEDESFYFMEMNTRLQVEHPVTEMITGQDLVEWQLRIASGEPLPLRQDELEINGHAFEARIYAEDPEHDFLPATGTLTYLQAPTENRHVRVDTGVLQGDEISVYYDPMIAKLIVWDESRERALVRLARALSEYRVSGVTTNISFLYNLATSKPFVEGDLCTGFIENHRGLLFHDSETDRVQDLPLASLYLLLRMEQSSRSRASSADPWSPWNASHAWRLNEPALHIGAIVLNGQEYDVPVEEIGSGSKRRFRITVGAKSVIATGELNGNELYADIDGYRRRVVVVPHDGLFTLFTEQGAMQFSLAQADYGDEDVSAGAGVFNAPMNGVIVKLLVEPGTEVKKDQPVIIMEAMKMEHTLCAPADGLVSEFYFQVGDPVDGGSLLLDFV